jgi:hypothetical protein
VAFDQRGVSTVVRGQANQFMAWDSLTEVGVLTTGDGPFGEDVFWILVGEGESSVCVIPQGASGAEALLARLQELPGFDNTAFINAMACADDNRFVCWRRSTRRA